MLFLVHKTRTEWRNVLLRCLAWLIHVRQSSHQAEKTVHELSAEIYNIDVVTNVCRFLSGRSVTDDLVPKALGRTNLIENEHT